MPQDKIKALMTKCECGVHIDVNEHRNYYQSAEEYLDSLGRSGWLPVTEHHTKDKMIALDTIIRVQFYPITPIGFHVVYHYDLAAALDEALKILDERNA
jgi:hypothetical protein